MIGNLADDERPAAAEPEAILSDKKDDKDVLDESFSAANSAMEGVSTDDNRMDILPDSYHQKQVLESSDASEDGSHSRQPNEESPMPTPLAMSDPSTTHPSSPSSSDLEPKHHEQEPSAATSHPKRRKKVILSDDDEDPVETTALLSKDLESAKVDTVSHESDDAANDKSDDEGISLARRGKLHRIMKQNSGLEDDASEDDDDEGTALGKERTTGKAKSRRSKLMKLVKARASKTSSSHDKSPELEDDETTSARKRSSNVPSLKKNETDSSLPDLDYDPRPDPKISALMQNYMTEEELMKARQEEEAERQRLAEKYKDDKDVGDEGEQNEWKLFSSDDGDDDDDRDSSEEAENIRVSGGEGPAYSGSDEEELPKSSKKSKEKALDKQEETIQRKKGASKKELLEMNKEKERLLRANHVELPSRKSALNINDILAQYGLKRSDPKSEVEGADAADPVGLDHALEEAEEGQEADVTMENDNIITSEDQKLIEKVKDEFAVKPEKTEEKKSESPSIIKMLTTVDRKISKKEASKIDEENRKYIRKLMETGAHRRAGKGKDTGAPAPLVESDDDIEIVDVDESTSFNVIPASVVNLSVAPRVAWNQQLRRLAEQQNKARREKELAEAERAAEEKRKRKEMRKAMRAQMIAEEAEVVDRADGDLKKGSKALDDNGNVENTGMFGDGQQIEETQETDIDEMNTDDNNESRGLSKDRFTRSPSEAPNTKENIADETFRPPPPPLRRVLSSPRIPFEELPVDPVEEIEKSRPPTPNLSEDEPVALTPQQSIILPEAIMPPSRKRESEFEEYADGERRVRVRTENGNARLELDDEGFAIIPPITDSQQDTIPIATQDSLFTSTQPDLSNTNSLFVPSAPQAFPLPKKPVPKKFGTLDALFKKAEEKAKKPSIIQQMKSRTDAFIASDSQDILGMLSGQFVTPNAEDEEDEMVGGADTEKDEVSLEPTLPLYQRVIVESESESDEELSVSLSGSESEREESDDGADYDGGDDADDESHPSGLFAKLRQMIADPVQPAYGTEAASAEVDDDSDDDGPVVWKKKLNVPVKAPKLPKSKFVEMEAEEEEDEFMGMGGPEDEFNSEDEDDGPLVCSGDEDQIDDFTDVVELHRQRELDDDSKLVESLLNDVTSGNLRRRLAGRNEASKGFTLSDSDDEEELLRSIRKGWYQPQRDNDDPNAGPLDRLAGQNETAPFARCFSSLAEEDTGLISDEDVEVTFSSVLATLSKQGSGLVAGRTSSKTSLTSSSGGGVAASLEESLRDMGASQGSVLRVAKSMSFFDEETTESIVIEESSEGIRAEATRLMRRVKPAIPFRRNSDQKPPLAPANRVSRIARSLANKPSLPGQQKEMTARLAALEASHSKPMGRSESSKLPVPKTTASTSGRPRKVVGGFLVGEAALKANAVKMQAAATAAAKLELGGGGRVPLVDHNSKGKRDFGVSRVAKAAGGRGSAGKSHLFKTLSKQESFQ
ncbi:hypothetical protein HDU67_005195 [Dinochytrium kinnereticum]|nr:hypothetical protein HDU67_005195 [Dinochytrium kinnereticum]